MELIDTHTHIYAEEFDVDRVDVVRRAVDAGVGCMLLPAIDSLSHDRLFDLCRDFPDVCIPMMGLHPTSVNDNSRWREELAFVGQQLAQQPRGFFCAVGEIGMDLYWSDQYRETQERVFRQQIEWALTYDLPIAVHVRDAWSETESIVNEYSGCGLKGVFHAFSGTVDAYHTLKECGDFVFGIGGVVTFKNSALIDVVRSMNLADIVLETDSPYLSPTPYRGKRNEPSYVALVCAKIAEIKALEPDVVALSTTRNARRVLLCADYDIDKNNTTKIL